MRGLERLDEKEKGEEREREREREGEREKENYFPSLLFIDL
jgi:hypothetical protein